jgi:tetratricopeptide (TPR) repeat protein
MNKYLIAILILLGSANTHSKEYGNYNPKRMLTVSETTEGKKYALDGAYLDHMLNDLASHAKNYPPQFDTQQDRQRAVQDVTTLSGMLDVLINAPTPNLELLARAGFLNSIGYNLNIAGSGEKTNAIFQKLLSAAPSNPRGNYMYGTFLAGAGKPKEALPYLEKALSVGVADAAYAIGMTYLTLGDKEKALKHLEDYKRRKPADENIDQLIDSIRNGKIELKKGSN